jgi:glycosyltransferase involved in cell wall biosynthesis
VKIALTADPEIPVPPRLYGGIERIVDMLARGLVAQGHNVTLFAHPESASVGRLVPWPGRTSRSRADTVRNALTLASHVRRGQFDVLHSFSRLAYLLPILPSRTPKIMSYQREISPRTTRLAHALSRGTLEFTAISDWMMRGVSHVGRWRLVPNGVDLDIYPFVSSVASDAPLVFLGRIEEIKGPHLAIEVARLSGRRLVIAGNIPVEKQAWAAKNVLAHVDGDSITYVGPVDDAAKADLLGKAFAFLMPILWEEPFGIVMAEALACGTPVLGFRRGAVPEVVRDGVTGFVREDLEGLVAAVPAAGNLSRAACRADVEERFSADPIVTDYLNVYRAAVERAAGQRRVT